MREDNSEGALNGGLERCSSNYRAVKSKATLAVVPEPPEGETADQEAAVEGLLLSVRHYFQKM